MTREDIIQYLREQESRPFEWGHTDCVQVCAGLIERIRGKRPDLPAYGSEAEAARELARLGGLEAAVSAHLGPMQRYLPHCCDGDVVLTCFGGVQGLGIATPRRFWVRQAGGDRFVPLDLTLAIGYWRA